MARVIQENLMITAGDRILDVADSANMPGIVTGYNSTRHGKVNQRWIVEYVSTGNGDPTTPVDLYVRSQIEGNLPLSLEGGLQSGTSLVLDKETPVIFGAFIHPEDPTAIVLVAQPSKLVIDLAGGREINANARQVTLAGFNPASPTQKLKIQKCCEGNGKNEDGRQWIDRDVTKEFLGGTLSGREAELQAPEAGSNLKRVGRPYLAPRGKHYEVKLFKNKSRQTNSDAGSRTQNSE
ncbi:hypothetical protein DFH06DRAFT_1147413 [Mycena polygramma]|nr:hypothetical protein DFH06DRAFT_1147413 [Mycena polygramma]